MTPLGHGTSAAVLAAAMRLPYRTCILGALAPDLDFLLFSLPAFNEIHRTFTHSLLFVALVALAAGIPRALPRSRHVAAALVGGIAHLAADSVLDANPTNGLGVPLFWPHPRLFSPFNLVEPVAGASWRHPELLLAVLPASLAWELPFWLAAGVLAWYRLKDRRCRSGSGE